MCENDGGAGLRGQPSWLWLREAAEKSAPVGVKWKTLNLNNQKDYRFGFNVM